MIKNNFLREILLIVLATIILALSVSYKNTSIFYWAILSFFIILSLNILTKRIVGYFFETKVETKFWSTYQYGFRQDFHFKRPLTMAWLPLVITLITNSIFWWLAILEFDVAAKSERVSRRHGLYRFTEVTEWHMAWIAIWGITINIAAAVIAYILGFELFTKLSIYYAFWSIIPISSLDGSKVFFSSKILWSTIFVILLFFLGWGLML